MQAREQRLRQGEVHAQRVEAHDVDHLLANRRVVADVDAPQADEAVEGRADDRLRQPGLGRVQARDGDVVIGARGVELGGRHQLVLHEFLGPLVGGLALLHVGPGLVGLRFEHGRLDREQRVASADPLAFLEMLLDHLPGHLGPQGRRRVREDGADGFDGGLEARRRNHHRLDGDLALPRRPRLGQGQRRQDKQGPCKSRVDHCSCLYRHRVRHFDCPAGRAGLGNLGLPLYTVHAGIRLQTSALVQAKGGRGAPESQALPRIIPSTARPSMPFGFASVSMISKWL